MKVKKYHMTAVEMVNTGLNPDPGSDWQHYPSLPMDSVQQTGIICCRWIISGQKHSLVV